MHALRDVELAHALDKWIHPELLRLLPGMNQAIRIQQDYNFNLDADQFREHMPYEAHQLFSQADNYVAAWNSPAPMVHSVPVFSPEFCRSILDELQYMRELGSVRFEPNPDEDAPFQIPEVVLEHECPALCRGIYETALASLYKWFWLAYQVEPNVPASIQLANYTPQGTSHGNWHHDVDSDFTAVVSLDPHRYTGGGTDVKCGLGYQAHIPKLPQGHALIFPGKHVMHRGCAVTAGERILLVFWLKLQNEDGK